METNEEMTKHDEGGKCCSSNSGGLKNLKTAIFVMVIIAACALAAHSVLINGNGSSCGGAAGLCPFNTPCAKSSTCALKAAETKDTSCIIKEANTSSPCCPGTETPACCPNAGTPDCCVNAETPSCCPTTAAPGCCPSLKPE